MSFEDATVTEAPAGPADSTGIAVELHGVGKCYQIYRQPQDRLKQSIIPRLYRWLGLPVPRFFREFWALQDVSLTIRKGETVGIIGRNGSGKSTLLQILCGTLTPTTGEVETYGKIGALLELGSGFNPEFTGRENIYMNGAVLGLSARQIDERFDDIVSFAEIGDFIDQPVKTYSSGMYVRLAFAVIAHADADILVIDEALSVGDVFFGQKCMRFLRDFMERGTVVFVSHDTSAVLNLCDRAVWLENGSIVSEGSAKEVTASYLEDLYYDSPSALPAGVSDSPRVAADREVRDMRQDLINSSKLRNDIEVFEFSQGSRQFGEGHAKIREAGFFDTDGKPLSWIVGGESVRLTISASAVEDIVAPIIGFEVYDRLGQVIFADNTYLATLGKPLRVAAGGSMIANFEFAMPIMREGDYTMSVAIATGTQQEHVQHHWIHEALAFHVHVRTICLGLVAVPMRNISLEVDSIG